jgi:hypothetical protein
MFCVLVWHASMLGACHFNTQPVFEGTDASLSRSTTVASEDADSSARSAEADDVSMGQMRSIGSARSDSVDAGSSAIADSGPLSCLPQRALGCERDALLLCAADGQSTRRKDCGAVGCNAADKRCNDCRPGAVSCRDDKLIHCSADGRAVSEQACAIGCSVPAQGDAACRICGADAVMCKDGNLLRCAADGLSWATTKCARGCDDKELTCRGKLLPTNIPREACSWTDLTARERTIEGEVTFDLDRECPRTVDQGPNLPQLCVYSFERFRVAKGATLRAVGTRALVLLSTDSIEIEGRISVSAKGGTRGPGALQSGPGVGKNGVGRVPDGTNVMMWTNLPAHAGGGGGGFGTKGAPGGDGTGECGAKGRCAEGGAAGEAYGVDTLAPLQGGASGGQNSAADWSTRRSPAGGGGGALQLVACASLKLGASAIVDANGGGGQGGNPGSVEMDSDTPGGGSGGGSGGAILVQAGQLSVASGAIVAANGGGGGGGATRTATGSAALLAGQAGQDGQLSDAPAAGGAGAGDSFAGGAGGAKDLPVAGVRTSQRAQAAGGGGGAVGRIRIETAQGALVKHGFLVSPSPSYGTVTVE